MSPAEMDELRVLVGREANRRGSQCTGKFKFPTFDMAKRAVRHKGLQAYHCTVCKNFHVGTPDRDRKLGIKGRITRLQERSREMDEEVTA